MALPNATGIERMEVEVVMRRLASPTALAVVVQLRVVWETKERVQAPVSRDVDTMSVGSKLP